MRADRIFLLLLLVATPALSLAGCSGSGDGAIVTSDPLAVPPDYAERPPRVGNTAQELSSVQPTWKTVFRAGDKQQDALNELEKANDPGQAALLREAGAQNVPADIRQQIASNPDSNAAFAQNFVDKLIAWQPPDKTPSGQAGAPSGKAKSATQSADMPSFNRTKSHSWLGSIF